MSDAEPAQSQPSKHQQQQARIASVNHWRGKCLDNFARVELAIIACSEALAPLIQSQPFNLAEAATLRTRGLREALSKDWHKDLEVRKLVAVLDQWSIREKERNDLVHGCFTIRPDVEADWILINEVRTVRKGIVLSDRKILNARQADAFLKAIVSERKQLEGLLGAITSRLS